MTSQSTETYKASFLRASWLFSRPHTVVGTTLSVLGLFVLAGGGSGFGEVATWGLALAACLGANIYIVGLNQLYDVAIDRINKPQLPLPAGLLSMKQGRWITFSALGLALVLAWFGGRYLMITVYASLVLGTMYSAPGVRLKRFPFWAAFSIFAVRGLIVNLFLFLHFAATLSGDAIWTPAVLWLTAIMLGISTAIALLKDTPDTEGDAQHGIATYALRKGPERILVWGQMVLGVGYLVLVLAGIRGIEGVNGPFLAGVHLLLFAAAIQRARRVEPRDRISMTRYYKFVWRLFFLEYIVFALAVIAAQ